MDNDVLKKLAETTDNNELYLDEEANQKGIGRIHAEFDEIVERLNEDALIDDCTAEQAAADMMLAPGQVKLGLGEDGVETLLVGTGVQPYLLKRDCTVVRPDDLDIDEPDGPVDYTGWRAVLREHADPRLVPAHNEYPGVDEAEEEPDEEGLDPDADSNDMDDDDND